MTIAIPAMSINGCRVTQKATRRSVLCEDLFWLEFYSISLLEFLLPPEYL